MGRVNIETIGNCESDKHWTWTRTWAHTHTHRGKWIDVAWQWINGGRVQKRTYFATNVAAALFPRKWWQLKYAFVRNPKYYATIGMWEKCKTKRQQILIEYFNDLWRWSCERASEQHVTAHVHQFVLVFFKLFARSLARFFWVFDR